MVKIESNNIAFLVEEWKLEAREALHTQIVVDALIEALNIEPSDEEFQKEAEEMTGEKAADEEELKKHYADEPTKEYLRDRIKERRLFDELLSKNTIKTGEKKTFQELLKLDEVG
jgi:FKBP-type peptidyl-prolyl cis-trans isomerase (trigger factor)